ncbi:hypothetical protein PoB_003666800 [Plakobranchus ocellatus]|uniref:Uncharacterized protein n=1 Tax=Plakobranchus ocellatus TaxID=259542 RepID=A0AAV4AS31_9GAST|nr:hypothetical protein PoB_003666800 [Plakobranchus ocellatus]
MRRLNVCILLSTYGVFRITKKNSKSKFMRVAPSESFGVSNKRCSRRMLPNDVCLKTETRARRSWFHGIDSQALVAFIATAQASLSANPSNLQQKLIQRGRYWKREDYCKMNY